MSASPLTAASPGGFRADIRGANLWDLVQLECMARRRVCVRVATARDVGFLYFDGGAIVHAATRRLAGEAAAADILSWEQGSFTPVETGASLGFPAWPVKRTIETSHEALILRAAQRRDEASATVLRFPATGVPATAAGADTGEPSPASLSSRPSWDGAGGELVAAVRLDGQGHVLEEHGSAGELAPVAAYVTRLAELLAQDLGLERLQSLECRFLPSTGRAGDASHCLLHLTDEGEILALQTRAGTDLGPWRMAAGLDDERANV